MPRMNAPHHDDTASTTGPEGPDAPLHRRGIKS